MASPFSTLLGAELEGKSGKINTDEALTGKVVGLYFSWYKLLKSQGKNLEIVFASSDRDQGSFAEYYVEMPWLALPFAERDRKQALAQQYKVQGIPMLVFIDEEGKLLTSKGRDCVASDPSGTDFPYKPKPLGDLLGPTFVDTKGNSVALSEIRGKKKAVALYFSASWCPPCQAFTPVLASLYNNFKASEGRADDLEVIYVANDRDEASFNDYFLKHHVWLAVPFADRSRRVSLMNHFEVGGIPTLVLLDGSDLKLITKDGVDGVQNDPTGSEFPYHPKPLVDLSVSISCNGYELNDKPALVGLCETLDDEEQGELTASLLSVALTYAEEAKTRDDGPRVIFFTNENKSRVGDKVRDMAKVAPHTSAVVLLDIPDKGAFYAYTKGDDYSETALRAFLDDYDNKRLERQQLGK